MEVLNPIKTLNLSFHRFPRDERRQEWLNRCKRMDKIDLDKSNSYYVCSAHFDEDDFESDLRAKLMNETRTRRLKGTAIPHLNLPSSTSKLVTKLGKNNSARDTRMKTKQMKQNTSEVLETSTAPIESEMSYNSDEINKKEQNEIEELKSTVALLNAEVASMKKQLEKYSDLKAMVSKKGRKSRTSTSEDKSLVETSSALVEEPRTETASVAETELCLNTLRETGQRLERIYDRLFDIHLRNILMVVLAVGLLIFALYSPDKPLKGENENPFV